MAQDPPEPNGATMMTGVLKYRRFSSLVERIRHWHVEPSLEAIHRYPENLHIEHAVFTSCTAPGTLTQPHTRPVRPRPHLHDVLLECFAFVLDTCLTAWEKMQIVSAERWWDGDTGVAVAIRPTALIERGWSRVGLVARREAGLAS